MVRFAVQVGSPELLQMLYVLTAADLGAVGPDVWDGWKAEVLTDLYHRTMQHLAGDSPATTVDELFEQRREAVHRLARTANRTTPGSPNTSTPCPRPISRARRPSRPPPICSCCMTSDAARRSVAGPVPARNAPRCSSRSPRPNDITPGIFHRLTGALTSHGLEIRTAQIHTLADGLVLDRFWVHDPDFAGEPPPRTAASRCNGRSSQSLRQPHRQPPAFRRTWQVGGHRPVRVPGVPRA